MGGCWSQGDPRGPPLTDVADGVHDGAEELADAVTYHLGFLGNVLDFGQHICGEGRHLTIPRGARAALGRPAMLGLPQEGALLSHRIPLAPPLTQQRLLGALQPLSRLVEGELGPA